MKFEMKPYIVYIQTDAQCNIIAVNSSAFLSDTSRWIEIDKGYAEKYQHAQCNYFSQPIRDMRGICRYKIEALLDWPNNKSIREFLYKGEVYGVFERSQEEMLANYKPAEKDIFPIDVLGDHEYRLCLLELGIGGEIE